MSFNGLFFPPLSSLGTGHGSTPHTVPPSHLQPPPSLHHHCTITAPSAPHHHRAITAPSLRQIYITSVAAGKYLKKNPKEGLCLQVFDCYIYIVIVIYLYIVIIYWEINTSRKTRKRGHACRRTAPSLHRHCTVTAPSLHRHRTVTAPSPQCHRTVTALSQHRSPHRTITVKIFWRDITNVSKISR